MLARSDRFETGQVASKASAFELSWSVVYSLLVVPSEIVSPSCAEPLKIFLYNVSVSVWVLLIKEFSRFET